MELKNRSEVRKKMEKGTRELIWHPYTQMLTAEPPIPIARAKGAYLYAENGTAYLDAISSWWVNLHGHAHPHIAKKIAAQAANLEHVMFAGFTHAPAVTLAEKLTHLTGMDKIFYSDNGSTAIETALKMVLQSWHNRGLKKKHFLSLKGAHHGETFGAMSVSGKTVFNLPFWDHLFPVVSLELPQTGQEDLFLCDLKTNLQTGAIAGFIFEPLILGPGGMKLYSRKALDYALQLCSEYGVPTIADEVMTGFGRTGPLFACDALEERPDILCLSKGITGGFLPLGATLCKQKIYETFLSSSSEKAFLHGHSYTANPIACAAALGSLDLLLKPECAAQREKIGTLHRDFCKKYSSHPGLLRCESLGTILILEYKAGTGYFSPIRERLSRYFLSQHILLRPLGNVIHVMPPYCVRESELEQIYSHLALSLELL